MAGILSQADMDRLAKLSGNAYDLGIIDMMNEHHSGAIQAAQPMQTAAVHQEVKTLATNIVASQRTEPQQMQSWKRTWATAARLITQER